MNLSFIVGLVCILLGLFSIAAGIGGGVKTMIKEFTPNEPQVYASDENGNFITELIKAIAAFTEVLRVSPTWLSMSIFGLILLGIGFYSINFFNPTLHSSIC